MFVFPSSVDTRNFFRIVFSGKGRLSINYQAPSGISVVKIGDFPTFPGIKILNVVPPSHKKIYQYSNDLMKESFIKFQHFNRLCTFRILELS